MLYRRTWIGPRFRLIIKARMRFITIVGYIAQIQMILIFLFVLVSITNPKQSKTGLPQRYILRSLPEITVSPLFPTIRRWIKNRTKRRITRPIRIRIRNIPLPIRNLRHIVRVIRMSRIRYHQSRRILGLHVIIRV